MNRKKLEILAPVGSMESLFAAVQNGADAVYLGGKVFSARKYASNFDYDELKKAINYAHLRGVKVYITVNTLIDNSEMDEILEYIKYLYSIDVDALIVQDLGFAYLVKEIFPDLEVHGSTQMTINNLPGAIFLEKNNFSRVVLARETPIEEIKYIKNNSNIELEDFIHGALCVCYSGQCLMSSIIGGRSGNRGSCAQPCRMEYEIVKYSTNEKLKGSKAYLLSSKDLNTSEDLERIIDSGIMSLKIEGRMKRPEYVATIVAKYRQKVDKGFLTDKDNMEMEQIFNRGFTKGNILGDFGVDYLSYMRPDNRGLYVGSVIEKSENDIYIKLEENLSVGDGLEIESIRDKNFSIRWNESSLKGDTIEVKNTRDIEVGHKVYRTSSVDLMDRANNSFDEENIRYPLTLSIILKIGEKPKITGSVGETQVEIETDYIIEKAKKASLSKDRVVEQMEKLNDTVYFLENITIKMENDIFMPISEVNKMRRVLIDQINEDRAWYYRTRKESAIADKSSFIDRVEVNHVKKLAISIRSYDQLILLNLDKVDRLYLCFEENLDRALDLLEGRGIEIYLGTETILYKKDFEKISNIIDRYQGRLDGILVDNIGSLEFIKNKYNLKIHTGEGLNVFNSFTAEFLKNNDVESIALSNELNLKQIRNLTKYKNARYETMVYGYIKVMTNRSCPMSVVKKCKDDLSCESCNFRQGYGLLDRKNAKFYTERINKNTLIYNSVPLMVLDSLKEIKDLNIEYFRMDFVFEREGIRELQEVYYDYLNGDIDKSTVLSFINRFKNKSEITKGHYFRGIM